MKKRTDILLGAWPAIGRLFVASFFLTSAFMKLTNGFFFERTAPLANDWQYWLDVPFTVGWYRPVLQILMPYADIVAVVVIVLHAAAGILLLLNCRVRLAGWILVFIQLNIWFATLKGWGFLVMVGSSVWIAFYYAAGPPCSERKWRWLTWAFIVLDALMIYGRYHRGDPWLSSFPSHYRNFTVDAMSSLPSIKHFVMAVSSGAAGPWIWASMWWLHLVLLALLFTRYRLAAGSVILALFLGRAFVWLNVLGAEAVMYVLFAYVWVAEEFRQESLRPPVRLSGVGRDVRSFFLYLRSRFSR